jgi:hypothetical protein
MRKTYKGHIKDLGVNGRFDAAKRDWNVEGGFNYLINEPDDSWMFTKVKAKEIWHGLSSETLGDLRQALTMAKGPVPKSEWDNSVLGDLASDKVAGGKAGKLTAPNTPLHPAVARAAAAPKGQASLAQQDAARPKRSIKKRSYGDSSFEGYGEGFPDDDTGMETGYSTGEGDGPGGQKRRKKVGGDSATAHTWREDPLISDVSQNPGPAQFGATARPQSYGPGMVGA